MKRNISFSFNFVFGTDADDESIFPATLAFLKEHKVPAAYFNLLVPLRGTPLWDRMKAEDRIIDEENMERWPGTFCHIHPAQMSKDQLVDQVRKLQRDFYTVRPMAQRLRIPRTQADLASWNVNLTQRKVALNSDSMCEFSEF